MDVQIFILVVVVQLSYPNTISYDLLIDLPTDLLKDLPSDLHTDLPTQDYIVHCSHNPSNELFIWWVTEHNLNQLRLLDLSSTLQEIYYQPSLEYHTDWQSYLSSIATYSVWFTNSWVGHWIGHFGGVGHSMNPRRRVRTLISLFCCGLRDIENSNQMNHHFSLLTLYIGWMI